MAQGGVCPACGGGPRHQQEIASDEAAEKFKALKQQRQQERESLARREAFEIYYAEREAGKHVA